MTVHAAARSLVVRHVRARSGGGLIVGLLVFVLVGIATSAVLALALLGDATVRDRLDALAPTQTDIASESLGLPDFDAAMVPTTQDVWGPFLAQLDAIRLASDAPLPEVMQYPLAMSRTSESPLAESPSTREVVVVFTPGYEDLVEIVDGRLPTLGEPDPSTGALDRERIEIALSVDTANEMQWLAGESRTIATVAGPIEVALTGIFDASDENDAYWAHATSILSPNIFDDGNGPRRVTGTGFAHPAALPMAPLFSDRQWTHAWFPVDPTAVSADTAAATAAAMRKLTSVSHPVGGDGYGISSVTFEAPVTAEIDAALRQQAATISVLTMLGAGPVGVAVAVLVLGCRLIVEARRSSLRLISARGASSGQLRRLLAIEGVIVGAIPAALAVLMTVAIGTLLTADAPPASIVVPAAALGLSPAAILIGLAHTAAERQERADIGRPTRRLRVIVEGIVTALAIVALVLLVVRGYSDGADVLLAATPLLLALVACLATLRLYPLPLRAIFFRARARAGLNAFLGSARALREPSVGVTPVLALVVGVSVAVSSGILLSTLQTGSAEASRAQIGADLRIAGGLFLEDTLDRVRAVDGVAAATGISGASSVSLTIDSSSRGTSIFVIDALELRDVQGDGPGLLPSGASLSRPIDGRMPLIASAATADDIGDTGSLAVDGVDAVVVGVVAGPVPVGTRAKWVAIDSGFAQDVLGSDPTDRTILVRLDDGVERADVEPGLRGVLGEAVRIDGADDVRTAIESGPAVQGVRTALLTATGVAALLSALAIAMTLALAARPRARVLALLRTLGASPRSASSLVRWEILPPTLTALIAGTVFGALMPLVVMIAVDLRPFTGSSIAPSYAVDPLIVAATLGGFVVAAVALTAIALFVSRRVRTVRALRSAEEG